MTEEDREALVEVFYKDVNKEASDGGGLGLGGEVNKQTKKGIFSNDANKEEASGEVNKQTNKDIFFNDDASREISEKVTREKVVKESQSKFGGVGELAKEVNTIDEEEELAKECENVEKVKKYAKTKKAAATHEGKKDKGKKLGPEVIKKEDREIWESLKEFDVKVAVFKGANVDKKTDKDKKRAPVAKPTARVGGKKKLKDENTSTTEIDEDPTEMATSVTEDELKAAEMDTNDDDPNSAEERLNINDDEPNAEEESSTSIGEAEVAPNEVETSVNNNRILFVKRPQRSKRLTIFESGTELNKINALAAVATLDMENVSKTGLSRKASFSCDLCHQKFANRSNLQKHTNANHSQGSVLLPVSSEYGNRSSLVSELEADLAEAVKISLGGKKKLKDALSPPPTEKLTVKEALKGALDEEEEEGEVNVKNKEEENSKAKSQLKDPDWLPDLEPNFVTTLVKVESFECKHCAAVYNNEVKLVKHQSRRHWQKKRFHKYKCDVCGATFRFRHNLRQHNQDTHNVFGELTYQNPSFKCDVCNVTFEYEDSLKIHVEYTHIEQEQQHEDESPNYPSQSEGSMDMENGAWIWENGTNGMDIGETQIEEAESEITKDKGELTEEETPHEEITGDDVRHSEEIEKSANKKPASKVSPNKNKYECKSCDSTFKLWDKLRKHMRTKHGQENGKKDQVENNDKPQDSRVRSAEVNSATEAAPTGSEQCSLCEDFKTFDSPKLRKHVKMHQNPAKPPTNQPEQRKTKEAGKEKKKENHDLKEKVVNVEEGPDENPNVDALF